MLELGKVIDDEWHRSLCSERGKERMLCLEDIINSFRKGTFLCGMVIPFHNNVQLVVGWSVLGHPLFPRVVSLAGLHFQLCGKEKMD